MALFAVHNVALRSVSAAVPKQEYNNAHYEGFSEQELKMFLQTVGVHRRRIAPAHMCASDYGYLAAKRLLEVNQLSSDSIDGLIFVSQSPDYYLPATAIILQNRLGLSKRTLAFDMNLGCSGYVYGLSVAASMISSGQLRRVLIVVGDRSSSSLNPRDKTAYTLFGDGVTASLLEYSEGKSMWFNLQSDGSGENAIKVPGGGSRILYREGLLEEKEIEPGIFRHACNLVLDGVSIMNFSLSEVKPNITELLEKSGNSVENIDYFFMHQANKLMNESIRKKLKFPLEKTPYSIERFGNTSSASIPLTMVTELAKPLSSGKHKLLLSGFGVGLSWGSVFLETDHLVIPELIEADGL